MPNWKGIIGKGLTADEFDAYMQDEYLASVGSWVPEFVVLHNTAIPKFADWHKVPGHDRMMGLQSYYRDDQRWSAGPHLFVADDLIWLFTPLWVPGVHAPSWNAISWGVEMIGDYDTEPFDTVKPMAVSALKSLHAALGIDPITLRFHKEDPLTTHRGCPGANVDKAEMVRLITE